jgi:site-specific DNA-methyltransferase (adenine-specific)
VVLARRPLDGTVAHNALAHGTGGINIDGTRIGYASEADKEAMSAGVEAIRERGGVMNNSWKNSSDLSGANPASTLGRWPANVVLSHSPGCRKVGETETQAPVINRFTDGMKPFGGGAGHPYESSGGGTETIPVYECEPDCPVRLLDEQSGKLPAGVAYEPTDGRPKSHSVYGDIGTLERTIGYGDSGGASRFFATFPADGSEETRFRYVAKASKAEREFGCEQLPARTGAESVEREEGSAGTKSPRAGSGRTSGDPIMQLRSDLTEEDRRLVLDQLQAAGVKI